MQSKIVSFTEQEYQATSRSVSLLQETGQANHLRNKWLLKGLEFIHCQNVVY